MGVFTVRSTVDLDEARALGLRFCRRGKDVGRLATWLVFTIDTHRELRRGVEALSAELHAMHEAAKQNPPIVARRGPNIPTRHSHYGAAALMVDKVLKDGEP